MTARRSDQFAAFIVGMDLVLTADQGLRGNQSVPAHECVRRLPSADGCVPGGRTNRSTQRSPSGVVGSSAAGPSDRYDRLQQCRTQRLNTQHVVLVRSDEEFTQDR
jgi:hypothetical protein